jgi:hypothetical protein
LPESDESESPFIPPRIGPPTVADEFELRPIRDIAVRELISHANSGTARVFLPLIPTTLKKGPFSIEIPPGSKVVFDFVVEDGRILRDREQTKGAFEPPIELPLGLKFRGIYVDDEGRVFADIAKFPNIRLSWLNVSSMRVPPTLDGLLDLLFKPKEDEEATDNSDEASIRIDVEGIEVEAHSVEPRDLELELGPMGHLSTGPGTTLEVEYSSDAISIWGPVEVVDAELSGAGFSIHRLRASGSALGAVRKIEDARSLRIDVSADTADIGEATVDLLDGSHLHFEESQAEDVDVSFWSVGNEAHWKIEAKKLKGKMTRATLVTGIGDREHPVTIEQADFEGQIDVSDSGYKIDLTFSGAVVRLPEHRLDFGIAHLDIVGSQTLAEGRLQFDSEGHYSFEGSIAIDARIGGGLLDAGPFHLGLADGTRIQLTVTDALGSNGLKRLRAKGSADLAITSGSVPIGPEGRLSFSRGATGVLELEHIDVDEDRPWANIQASARLRARVDPLVLEEVVEIPGGEADISVGQIYLDEAGTLILGEVAVSLESDPPEPS